MKLSLRRRVGGPLMLMLALLPGASVALQWAESGDAMAGWRERQNARRRVLRKIPGDASVLINVTAREMPASPDILNLGRRSTRALERCLSDNVDANLRSMCAEILQALGDRRALGTLQTALADWDSGVRWHVIQALRAMPDKSSAKPLLALLDRKDETSGNKTAILMALGSISDKRVVQRLRKEVKNKPKKKSDPDLRSVAFDALWENRHLVAPATLVGDTRAALGSDDSSLVLSATLASAELRSPRLVSSLIPLMEHKNSEIRNKAVYALGRIGDKKATKALLERLPEVRGARMLNNIAFALERLDKKAFYASIKNVARHKQAIIRLNAAFVLGDVKHPEGVPLLVEALKDPSDYVRTSAIVALGKIGSPDGAKALDPYVKDANLSVREEAIHAMHKLTKGGRKDLLHDKLFTLSRSKHGSVVRRAALALGKTGDTRVKDYLLRCVESYGCNRKDVHRYFSAAPDAGTSSRLLLAWTRGGRRDIAPLVALLNPTGTLPLARSMVEAQWGSPSGSHSRSAVSILGSVGDKSVVPLLKKRANTTSTYTRVHALVALARLGDTPAQQRLVAELDELPDAWLGRYVKELSAVKEKKAREALDAHYEKRTGDKRLPLAMAAAAIRLGWFPDKAIFRFIEALGSDEAQERDLAERYLRRNDDERVTWLLRRALAREKRAATRDRLRMILDERG